MRQKKIVVITTFIECVFCHMTIWVSTLDNEVERIGGEREGALRKGNGVGS